MGKKFFIILFFLWSVICAEENKETHYEVSLVKDMPVVFFSAFSSVFGSYRYSQMAKLDKEDIPKISELLPWDRPIAGRYSQSAELASRIGAVFAISPIALSLYSWKMEEANSSDVLDFSLMFLEAIGFQHGINMCVRSMEFWPRPYIYAKSGEGKKQGENARGEAYGSFFSGHTSAAFTVATFTGEWFSEFYPNSPYKKIVWTLAYSMASFEGVLRIAAGKHYPTDVLVGALVGVGISFAVIHIHKNRNETLSFYVAPCYLGFLVHI